MTLQHVALIVILGLPIAALYLLVKAVVNFIFDKFHESRTIKYTNHGIEISQEETVNRAMNTKVVKQKMDSLNGK